MQASARQGWEGSPTLFKLASSQQGGSRGAQLWGVQYNGRLNTIYQLTPGGDWSEWRGPDWADPGAPKQAYELTAAQQNNGCVQFWTLDEGLRLWTTWQTSPGGDWTEWSGPGWDGAPKLLDVSACQQGGSRGAQVWGITEDYTLISDYQPTPGGNWSGWSTGSWLGAQPVHEVTAAQQNDGCVRLWAVTTQQVLASIAQTSPGGDWTGWS